MVALEHATRVRIAILCREGRTVNEVAAVHGKSDPLARFELLGARLGILARETADAHHSLLLAMDQDEAHLQQNFDLVGNCR